MPSTIVVDILYSEGGYINNRQIFIVSAKVYLKYETVYYVEKTETNLFHLELKSIGNFINLALSNLEKTPEQPGIFPALPIDFVNPLA